ncbi:MAG: MATE family efflux transporter, partial [Lachnospiraceae bacterium]|nr:MATE family efflux transporter [Lachnospiraceae bacterium]
YRLCIRDIRFHGEQVRKILQIGLPAGLQGTVFSLSNVVIQSSVNSFGATVMAGNAAAMNIEGFVYMAMNAFHQAAVSFVSQNVGAGKFGRINKIVLRVLLCVTVTGCLFGWGAVLFGHPLLAIYSPKETVIAQGMIRLGIICAMYALCGIMDVMVGVLRGLGYSVMPMIVSLLGACGLRLLWIFTIFRIPQYHTTRVLYFSYPMSWIITFSVHMICFLIVRRRFPREDVVPERKD